MQNLSIHFDHPWLLLAFIPAIALTIVTYFMVVKRYRNTRNKIISIVLHSIVMTLAILVLAGTTFPYEMKNSENEFILLVDLSETQFEATKEDLIDETNPTMYDRDSFVQSIIDEASYNGIKTGIVTFGFNQNYIAPLTFDTEGMFDTYMRSSGSDTPEGIDTSASDIAAALRYTATLFQYPKTAKILLITDGYETDENALTEVRNVVAQGITVDVAQFDSGYSDDGVQLMDIEVPSYNIRPNEECTITVVVQSMTEHENVYLDIYDNDELLDQISAPVNLARGNNRFDYSISFENEGMHELRVELTIDDQGEYEYNNKYYRYINLKIHDKVLIVEHREGDSEQVEELLAEQYPEEGIKTVNVKNAPDDLPDTIGELQAFDQVILNNIANEDLPESFVALLQTYVHDAGGGLLTLGGDGDTALVGPNGQESEDLSHAYNHLDLHNTDLEKMLPIQAIDYTPPIGVVFVMDVSGSMANALEWAKSGAISCLDVLNQRDYVGVMTLADSFTSDLQLTSCTLSSYIKERIRAIGGTGSTYFTPAVSHAAEALKAESRIDKRHIVVVSDAQFFDVENAVKLAKSYPDVTLSIIGTKEGFNQENSDLITEAWSGKTYTATSENNMFDLMRDDLKAPTITQYTPKDFTPNVNNSVSPLLKNVEYNLNSKAMTFQLGGYYGVRARSGVDIVVTGEYEVPIYAQWKYGLGNVGSFMCDLYGHWSGEMLSDANGRMFMQNVVSGLMPVGDIRPTSIILSLNPDSGAGDKNDEMYKVKYNYYNSMTIYTTLEEGETLKGEVIYNDEEGQQHTISLNAIANEEEVNPDCYVMLPMNEDNNFLKTDFVTKDGGVYTIRVTKLNAQGAEVDRAEVYRYFSYSTEYDYNNTQTDPKFFLTEVANRGRGSVIELRDPQSALTTFVTAFDRVFDPRWLFMIIAIVCFLLDIAVRKFKFKWIHEIIRERKERKGVQQ